MGTVADVRIAKRTGFCYGVREAIDKAKEAAAAGKATHTLGQVVHNEGVIRDLQALGIQTVDTLDDVDHGAAVVIRAHGVRPEVMERRRGARPRGHRRHLHLGDPGAARAASSSSRRATRSSCSARPKHPEVVGLLGFAPDAIVVDEEDDWDRDPAPQEDGAHHPEHPAALEVREARRVHGLAQPTSSRSSTRSARSRSGARRTPSRRPARST